jgi:hypothetical protein
VTLCLIIAADAAADAVWAVFWSFLVEALILFVLKETKNK